MITPAGTLRERVSRLVRARAKDKGGTEKAVFRWVVAPGSVTVRETQAEGEASVEFKVPEGCEALELWLPTGLFGMLVDDKNTDGALLLVRPDDSLEAHIVECKKTADSTKWEKAREQMSWTLVKLQALAGALGKELAGGVFYTAFRHDKLGEEESPNPAAAERIVGSPEDDAEAAHESGRRAQLDWMRDRVQLRGFEGRFAHRRIRLNEDTGQAPAPVELRPLLPRGT